MWRHYKYTFPDYKNFNNLNTIDTNFIFLALYIYLFDLTIKLDSDNGMSNYVVQVNLIPHHSYSKHETNYMIWLVHSFIEEIC